MVRWCEDHAARELDRWRADLADEVGTGAKLINSGFCGALKVSERVNERPLVKNNPLIEVFRQKLVAHSIEGSDVVSQHSHDPIPSVTDLITTRQVTQVPRDGAVSRQATG